MKVNDFGYVVRKSHGFRKPQNSKPTYRDWWFVKYLGNKKSLKSGVISLGNSVVLHLPKKYIGKKIMLKVEVIEEAKK